MSQVEAVDSENKETASTRVSVEVKSGIWEILSLLSSQKLTHYCNVLHLCSVTYIHQVMNPKLKKKKPV